MIAQELAARIRADGPITVHDYMAACIEAYYARGHVFGADGDFITSPEISQAFGEIVGLWCAVTWQQLGAPKSFRLVECGPGRGTLMADVMRAAARVAGFAAAARIHLVERSSALREKQRTALKGHVVTWHGDVTELPVGPAIILANEFLDALPVRQWEKTASGWVERCIDADSAGRLHFTLGTARDIDIPLALSVDAPQGAIFETAPTALDWTTYIAARLKADGGAALVIDYGAAVTGLGDTLQAVKAHRFHPVLKDPGDADLTAHVDFARIAAAARIAGARVFGPVEQGRWLTRLGIGVRAAQLTAGKSPDVAEAIKSGIHRLTAPEAMGALFKVLALTHPGLAACEGFEQDAPQ